MLIRLRQQGTSPFFVLRFSRSQSAKNEEQSEEKYHYTTA
jgi:hypothetical protein